MSKIFEQLLEKRSVTEDFLHPKYEAKTDPFLLYSMDKAVARLKKAREEQERILIYGDYDVDGVTASTAMEEVLKLIGVRPDNIYIMLPDRFADGYGMSPKLITKAKNNKVSLVITVDCGSGNFDIIDELNTLKIDTIVTDHHKTAEVLPDAVALINPHRKDHPTAELQNLAGVGVVFKVAEALVKEGLIKNGQEKWLLDLVLIGTICDSMTMTNENRRLCFYGAKVLAKTRRAGLIELMKKAGIKRLNTESIGFQLGPRLNAAGRLDTADLALDLLHAKDSIEAAPLAERLEELNKKRKAEQQSCLREIEQQGIGEEPVIIKTGKWHEGILGIVAGRLVEQYHKPSFVLAELENNIYKGSGRSFGDYSLADALSFAKDSIISGGGHTAAAGVKLEGKNLYSFREQINEYYRSLHLANQEKYFLKQADLELTDFSELGLNFLDELRQLEPYGAGNEEPVFQLKNVEITEVSRMGTEHNHLRLDLKDQKGNSLKLVAFFAPKEWLNIDPDFDRIEPLVKFIENDFNGVKSLEARICDIIML